MTMSPVLVMVSMHAAVETVHVHKELIQRP